ncbi:hypothetical protein [Modestobacter sp. NPDC049651]|uniref:hypothetical protein n=1 Tax=unclassified Modestobacter TaxID=2643866 RepID=UPI0033CFF443
MTFLVVAGVLLVALLAAMAVHDRRARARGARLNPDAGAQSGRRGLNGTGNVDAYRGSDGTHPSGGW